MTAKLARAPTSAGATPGRLMISRIGAGTVSTASGVARAASSSAMRRGSGRTQSTSAKPAMGNATAASHASESASVDS